MFGSGDEDDGENEDEWRYSLEDLEDIGEDTHDEGTAETAAADEEGGDEEGGGAGIAGSFDPSETIEPGKINPENAAFVVLGVLLAAVATGNYVLMVL